MRVLLIIQGCLLLTVPSITQRARTVGKFEEVFAWKQITYDIGGIMVLEDRFAGEDLTGGRKDKKLSKDNLYFSDEPENQNEMGRFFIQYNNVPMGAERVGNRLFITIPRRRFGIPATINYIDLSHNSRSPPLSPYPNMSASRSLISVYRTRADECGRLWAVDTGALEIPNNVAYLQPPAIVVYDLNTDRQILRYQLKSSDLPAANTPTGLASITIELRNGDCSDAYAYIADLVTYGVIVYSLRENNSWRHSHNYFSFVPTAGNLRVAGQSFQWNDGIFSMTLGKPDRYGCRPAYFHPMVSNQEFSVSTCELQKTSANQTAFTLLGDRGADSQSTMHGYHAPTNVLFFADVGRDAVSCWNVDKPLNSNNVAVLARDEDRMSYPSDLHVTGDEVWVIANKLPRFIYSRLDTNQYNFFVYKAKVRDLISGTACDTTEEPFYFGSSPYYNRYSRKS